MKTINLPVTHGGLKGRDLVPIGAWAYARSSSPGLKFVMGFRSA